MSKPAREVRSLVDFFFLSTDSRMHEFRRIFNRVARTDMPVVFYGEPGTGKELMARALHQRSLLAHEPFYKIDCQLSPQPPLEAELDRLRCQRSASETSLGNRSEPAAEAQVAGTVFFHEIASLGPDLQAKVLALLPEGDGGESRTLTMHTPRPRVLASTSRDLRKEVAEGRFRSNLYFSLGGVLLEIPALRTRKDDLALLADHFLRKYCSEFGRMERPQLSLQAMETLRNYDWPGNLPEFSSVMKRIVFLSSAEAAIAELDQILASPAAVLSTKQGPEADKAGLKVLAKEAAQRVEREMILKVLREKRWNRKRTAVSLNISYKTLLFKIKQLGLTGEP